MLKTSDLKPCKCGNDCFLITTYRNRIEIKCPKCGLFIVTRGRKSIFNTLAKCQKNVWPLAVEEWNRRVSDA